MINKFHTLLWLLVMPYLVGFLHHISWNNDQLMKPNVTKNNILLPFSSYNSTTGVFTVPPGGMESTTSLPILFISSYDSTTGVFTVPPGGDATSLPILFISSYDSTTGVFTVPPGGDGVYYFSTYLIYF